KEEFKFADGSGAEIGDRASFLLAHHRDGRQDGGNQHQHQYDNARDYGVDTLEGLIVAKAIFHIKAAKVGARNGVGTQSFQGAILRIEQGESGHIAPGGFAAEWHGAVDPDGDAWRM